jgi:hypothetical protein
MGAGKKVSGQHLKISGHPSVIAGYGLRSPAGKHLADAARIERLGQQEFYVLERHAELRR